MTATMQYDQIPSTDPNESFPYGDINFDTLSKGWEWMDDAKTNLDFQQYMMKVRRGLRPEVYTNNQNSKKTNEAAIKVCVEWGKDPGSDRAFAICGYSSAQTLGTDIGLFPQYDYDLSETVNLMKLEQKPLVTYKEFARAAWSSMQHTHPRVYDIFTELYNHSVVVFKDMSKSDRYADQFRAGVGLYYALANTAMLANLAEMDDFTGMVVQEKDHRKNLKETKFAEWFFNKKPLYQIEPEIRFNIQDSQATE
jgi:hypothetical protein